MNKPFTPALSLAIFLLVLCMGCKQKVTPLNEQNEVSVDETFEIRVKENPSTGYGNCWLNSKDANAISLVKKEYKQEGSSDCAGCGGVATFTFKGKAKGTDTILIVNCPTGRENKSCDECSGEEGTPATFIAIVK